jgi:hypothetical protein
MKIEKAESTIPTKPTHLIFDFIFISPFIVVVTKLKMLQKLKLSLSLSSLLRSVTESREKSLKV